MTYAKINLCLTSDPTKLNQVCAVSVQKGGMSVYVHGGPLPMMSDRSVLFLVPQEEGRLFSDSLFKSSFC